jgi:hypothetical protein
VCNFFGPPNNIILTHSSRAGHENSYKFGRQIEKARVESQPIVTIEATLQLTIPALIKSSTKDLWNQELKMKKWYTIKVNLTKVPDINSFVSVGFPA